MFGRHLQERRFYEREYTVKGTLNGAPVLLTVRGSTGMVAVERAMALNPGLKITSVHVNKGVVE